ncbi:monooxygenase 1-like [Zingiber officinale]|uniref:monooxygenase 1-like n=1 Tax=Zingiber officinale TaxID=94328 RepID=UPI001C4D068A|nr:monooxygenase 1-like [Zingiber officinale]
MSSIEEHHGVVVLGGGICGLATALALQRKGIKSLVLEKSNKLRSSGAAIGIWANGWHALDQLMVGSELRPKAIPLSEIREVWLESNRTVVTSCREVELRCLRRSDLIETMASKLPSESIRFGCKVVAVKLDHTTSFPILFLEDGIIIKAKVLIGCDGSDSIIAKSLQLKEPKVFPMAAVRGFTTYQSPHSFGTYFFRIRYKSITFGRIPINDKLVHWFIGLANPAGDHLSRKDLNFIKKIALDSVRELPSEISEIVKHCDLDSLSIHCVWYRHPWHLFTGKLSNGTMTVAGDAMHVMGPFLGQGGSAGLEDAIVLARCLTQAMPSNLENSSSSHSNLHKRIDAAYRNYIKERRLRVIRLSTQSYLTGLIMTTKSWIVRVICVALLMVLFGGNTLSHTRFNCGLL